MGNYFVPVAFAAPGNTETGFTEGETELITGTEVSGHEEVEASHEGGLALDPATIVFQAINFLVLLLVLRMILYKPLLKLMKEREERIKDGIENAAKADRMMEESEETRLQTIKAAKVESHGILESARTSAEDTKAGILERAQQEADKIVDNGRNIVELEKQRAAQELREESINLVIQTAEKILREKLDDIKDRKIIEENLKNYSL